MSLLNRVLLNDGVRCGRLRDYRGNRVSTRRLFRNAPRAVFSAIGQHAFRRPPARPWIAYDGQAKIDLFLDKTKRVLEFGSGMSTHWYAERAGQVVSLEDNEEWYDRIHDDLVALGNVDHRYCESLDEYLAIGQEQGSEPFDFVMIDGSRRDKCLEVAMPLLAPGGMLYLDNSDMFGDEITGDIPAARAAILSHAERNGDRVETLTDFAPTLLFVIEATILYKS